MKQRLIVLGVVAGLLLAMPLAGYGQAPRKPEAAQAVPGDFPKPKPVKPITDIRVADVFADACRVWFRVENSGNVTIDKVLRERVWVDGVVVDQSQMHYVLKPGAVFAHGVGADPGVRITGFNKPVKVTIDADGALAESDETNNTKEVTLSCKLASAARPGAASALVAKPDLVVSFEFKNAKQGTNASGQAVWTTDVEYTVTNQGSGDAGPCVVHMEQGSGPEGAASSAGADVSMPAIAAGKTVTKMFGPYSHAGPTQVYRATVDFRKAVAEASESNNQFVKPFPG